ncbi:MOFRL family protein [Agrobacterium tumefaciens]|uniref:MOFRL family protein n=1 Tax=Agrobacterium tumefaciens TaxID=358 RepID=UPI003BB987BC
MDAGKGAAQMAQSQSSRIALEEAAALARVSGGTPVILSVRMEGGARDVGLVHAAIAREIVSHDSPFVQPCVVLSRGETTVSFGEFALSLAMAIDGFDVRALAADTDGVDGSGDNAGAFADGTSVERLLDKQVNGDARLWLEGVVISSDKE